MEDPKPRSRPALILHRDFRPGRLAGPLLASAYEHLLPVYRLPLGQSLKHPLQGHKEDSSGSPTSSGLGEPSCIPRHLAHRKGA